MAQQESQSRTSGYALLIVMLAVTILLIMLTQALPSVYTEAQREKEKELIFRGTQYARAIYLFHQKFNRYPTSVKELLHTNDLSFLRHAWPDPMSRDGKWRFIHAGANGAILDSQNLRPPTVMQPGSNQPGHPQEGFGFGASPQQNSQQSNQQNSFSLSSQSDKTYGAYIVGVASSSKQASIRVYNGHFHYNKWEFLGIPGVPGSVVNVRVAIPGAGTPQPQPQSPGLPTIPTMPPLTSPTGSQ